MVMALARAIAIAMECPTVDRTFGMLAPAQRATPGKGLRLASQTLIPGHVRREPDVGHPTPEARLYPPTQTYAPPPTHINDEKKKIFSSLGPRIRPLEPPGAWKAVAVAGAARRSRTALIAQ